MPELRICVLGGTGFVGRSLVARLAGAGHRIRVPSRNAARHRDLLVLPTVSIVTADVHDPATLAREFAGMDCVVNLIGILNERSRDGSGFRRAHTELAQKVVTACHVAHVGRLLHMSALKADAQQGPSFYLRTKGEAENVVREHSGERLHWTIFQPSVMFGPDDSFTNRFAKLLRLSPVLPLARPDAQFAPVYVEDVVQAMQKSLSDRKTFGKSYELCGPRIYSLRAILALLRRSLGLRRWVIGLPDSLSRLQARIFDFVPGKPFSTDNDLSLTVPSTCGSNGFARFGIQPHSLEALLPLYLRP